MDTVISRSRVNCILNGVDEESKAYNGPRWINHPAVPARQNLGRASGVLATFASIWGCLTLALIYLRKPRAELTYISKT